MQNFLLVCPLASGQVLEGVSQSLRQLDMLDGSLTQLEPRTTQAQTGSVTSQPTSVTQSQPSVSAPAGASAQTVHSGQPGAPPGASAAVVTVSPSGPVQAKATANTMLWFAY